tara:strand:- start:453 stop:635 length:183 start_codon:yes stop_codon:yes gene_type:complete
MSHHFDKKIEERSQQLQAAVDQYNNALGIMNATKEQIISLQGSLAELETLKKEEEETPES